MSKCSHCDEERTSRCAYGYCPLEIEQADETIINLQRERERLALAICGGEDAPGYANSQTVETLELLAKENERDHSALVDRFIDVERQLSEAVERAERAERNNRRNERQAATTREAWAKTEGELARVKAERDDYLNKALMADLDRQAAIDRHAELVECLETGEAFGFDPATGFGHADDGGAPESCVFYVPKASTTAAEAEVARLREALKFYADVSKYPAPLTGGMGALWSDCGQIARAALQGEPKP